MTTGDWIQTALLSVTTLSLAVLAAQTLLQNRLLKAQLLRDRFEMYWRTYEPVTKEQVQELVLYPEDYMAQARYKEKYEGNERAIAKYIYMSILYEYLAFTYTSHNVLKVPDPLGGGYVERWTNELVSSSEFMDVHQEYAGYYPQYERFVDDVARRAKSASLAPAS